MKRIMKDNTGCLYIGSAREICSLYKNFVRKNIAIPTFCDFPKFNMSRYYGLSIDTYDEWNECETEPRMQIVAGDKVLAMVYNL